MCYVGRLKGSMYLVNARLVVKNCCKDLANTRLDLRNAANSLQIEGKGVLLGDPYHWGGWGRSRNTEPGTRDHICIYVYMYICIYVYM